MKIVVVMKLSCFSLRLFVGIRKETKILANTNVWQSVLLVGASD